MRFPIIFLAMFALAMLFSGCSWLPAYMEAKAAINARYEKKEESLELRYSKGQISDESYEKQYEELYRQWDQELTVAKARAQGYEVAGSGSSSRKRRSASRRSSGGASPAVVAPATAPATFDTQTTEYVGVGAAR